MSVCVFFTISKPVLLLLICMDRHCTMFMSMSMSIYHVGHISRSRNGHTLKHNKNNKRTSERASNQKKPRNIHVAIAVAGGGGVMLLHYSRFIEHFRFMDIECHIHTNEESSTLFTSLPLLLHDWYGRKAALHQAHSSHLFCRFSFWHGNFSFHIKRSHLCYKEMCPVRKVQWSNIEGRLSWKKMNGLSFSRSPWNLSTLSWYTLKMQNSTISIDQSI